MDECSICAGKLRDRQDLEGPDRSGVAPGTFGVAVCESCGTGFTTPHASEEELPGFYGESYGPHAVSPVSELLGRAFTSLRLSTRLFGLLGDGDGRAVLDVGSGRGELLAGLARLGWDVTGVEPSPSAGEHARERLGVPSVTGTLSTAREQLTAGAFDAVIFHHSLEHVADPVGDLRLARELSRPAGLVLIAVPNFGSRAARRLGGSWWALDLPRHRTHFTSTGLSRAITAAGLDMETVLTRASVLGPAANAWHRLTGGFNPPPPAFLASYGLAAASFPVTWLANALRGEGEFLAAIARA